MARVIITPRLRDEVERTFKQRSVDVFSLMRSLAEHPKKGKPVGAVGNVAIKELKYEGFRFYFMVNRHKVKFLKVEELTDLLIKFVRMSRKKDQDRVIEQIKDFLRGIDTSDVM